MGFSIGSDSDSDPLIRMYVLRTEICPLNRYSSHLGKGSKSESVQYNTTQCVAIAFGFTVRA